MSKWLPPNVLAYYMFGNFLFLQDLSVYNPSSIITKRGTEGNCCTFVGEGVSIGRAFAWEFGQTCFLILGVCSIIHPKNLARLESYPVKMGILIFALLYSGVSRICKIFLV